MYYLKDIIIIIFVGYEFSIKENVLNQRDMANICHVDSCKCDVTWSL